MKPGDQSIIDNLRRKFPTEFARFSDQELIDEYNNFSMSEMYGDNDARFPEWIMMTDG